jgi:hypothetical protein
MQLDFDDFLIINGEIYKTQIKTDEERQVKTILADAKMSAFNNSNSSVFFVNPKYYVQSKIKYFKISKEYFFHKTDLYSADYPHTILKNDNFAKLEKDLDEGKTPENFILKLESGEKYFWNAKIYFEFELTGKNRKWKGVTWNELLGLANSFWFRFEFHLPVKLNSLKSKLLDNLDEIWRNDNEPIPIARLRSEDFTTKLMFIQTQPIFIDLSPAEISRKC